MTPDIRAKAAGHWLSILPALGIDSRYLVNKGGPCPLCAGKDRFRFDDKEGEGTWFCNQCGAGDGFKLIQLTSGKPFRDVARLVEPLIGQSEPVIPSKPDPERLHRQMRSIWRATGPLEALPATRAWWDMRTGQIPLTGELRGHSRLRYQDGLDGPVSYHPAMVARIRDSHGKCVSLHRTYLSATGKAPVPKPRKLMPGDIPPGSSVWLAKPTDILGIAEGIETAISATILHDVPCWASLNTSVMKTWSPPSGVKRVVIFADNDQAGILAAQVLAGRLVTSGLQVSVELPELEGQDWNDVLRGRA